MIVHLAGTRSGAVADRLVTLREEGGVTALGRVLTLVVLATGDGEAETAVAAANAASREHPCRIVVVVPSPGEATGLAAEVRVGADAGASEVVILRPGGDAGTATDSLVVPLLLPDVPVVVWWPGEPPAAPAADPVGAMAQRRITDALACPDPPATVRRLRAGYAPGDTDLSWARSTPWRARLAAALDEPPHDPVLAATVVGPRWRTPVELLAGWLADRLDCPVRLVPASSGVITQVRLERPGGAVTLAREPDAQEARLSLPGMPDRFVSLPVRTLEDCLREELRGLAPDETYGQALTRGLALLRDGRAA
ncbi:glucose-6-phosphate dehydrogenase assembly protein OpcA [Georgenia thermotolerans]|uniref:OpcA protein n=1 Tax=Georgenia thermotolerans TaxID=527326 RepID=A0A7J5ULU6_9MICO|nr:glucose-6-phosphate dehydrogenase assembly protein OpcA [Georgenia thermotolerans]KAE8763342.1 OpcA protein [Georgenia thermotolerans]